LNRARLALTALLAGACVTSAPPTVERTRATPAREARLPTTVDVLLYRGPGPVRVAGAELRRSDAGLAGARGAELGRELLMAGTFDGRPYPGRLIVTARPGRLEVRNRAPLEDYVAGVLAAEVVLWSARPAELEAQAIVARSYAAAALAHRGAARADPYLFGDTRDQAYRGLPPPDYAERVRRAVERTRGRVLREGGRVVHARFHAACGGATADGRAVFPELDFDCMRSVSCSPCTAARRDLWRVTSTRTTLEAAAARLGIGRRLESVAPAARDASGRWLSVTVRGDAGERVVPFQDLRMSLDPTKVESTRILRTWPYPGEPIEDGLFLEGHGRGHGVGLCQTGAKGYAAEGWSADEILAHYYPGAALR
jgi:stage II sporulation protein D